MRVLLFASLLLSSNVFANSAEFKAACEKLPAPSMTVVLEDIEPSIDNSVSFFDLTRERKSGERPGITIGKTSFSWVAATSVASKFYEDPVKKEQCFSPQIVLKLKTTKHLIRVAKEFSPDSCGYRNILEHELIHAGINSRQLKLAATYLQDGVAKEFKPGIIYGSLSQWKAAFNVYSEQKLNPVITEILKQSDAYHAKLDSPEEYAKNIVACQGEISGVLHRFL